jgi:Rrf2 family protein
MLLSTTTQYTLKIVEYLRTQQMVVSATELSQNLEIPYKYLTKIMTKLTKNGVVSSLKGRNGGFALLLNDITLYEVLKINEDDTFKQCILGNGICSQQHKCHLHDAWKKPKHELKREFLDLSLEELSKTSTPTLK